MRAFLPALAAATNTDFRKFSLLTACEQLKVKRIPPGAICLKGSLVQSFISLQGITQYILMLGKGRRVQDHQIVGLLHLPEVAEGIHCHGLVARIAGKVQFGMLPGQVNGLPAAVHAMEQLGSSTHGIDAETTGISKHIQDLTTFGIVPYQFSVFALINEKTCLLPCYPVYLKMEASIPAPLPESCFPSQKSGLLCDPGFIGQGAFAFIVYGMQTLSPRTFS